MQSSASWRSVLKSGFQGVSYRMLDCVSPRNAVVRCEGSQNKSKIWQSSKGGLRHFSLKYLRGNCGIGP